MLVATAIILLLMAVLGQGFVMISNRVKETRSIIEMRGRLQATHLRLEKDLRGTTARLAAPLDPSENLGYFEIVEGPMGPVVPYGPQRPGETLPTTSRLAYQDVNRDDLIDDVNGDNVPDLIDPSVEDNDDVLQFTARSQGEPFQGRFTRKRDVLPGEVPDGNDAIGPYVLQTINIESEAAEISWFMRGSTLYRRVLLILKTVPDTDVRAASPGLQPLPADFGFYRDYDVSARLDGGVFDRQYPNPFTPPGQPPSLAVLPNSLSDLTDRANRYGHQPWRFPHAGATFWGQLGLPTLRESSHIAWPFPVHLRNNPGPGALLPSGFADFIPPSVGAPPPLPGLQIRPTSVSAAGFPGVAAIDFWNNPHPWLEVRGLDGDPVLATLNDYATGPNDPNYARVRLAEDIILTDVIQFDVKVYDPTAVVLCSRGADGQAGVAGMDDNFDNSVDNDAELGWAESDDVCYVPGDPGYPTAVATFGRRFFPVGLGGYVDLGNAFAFPGLAGFPAPFNSGVIPQFASTGDPRAQLVRNYDTWSTSYERDGLNQNLNFVLDPNGNPIPVIDEASNGLDDNGIGGADDSTEWEAPPPYPSPVRGIQVQITCLERDSRQAHRTTLRMNFPP
jgi:hypothetical protein